MSNLEAILKNFIQETKKVEERYLEDKLKQFIQAQTKANQRYEESLK